MLGAGDAARAVLAGDEPALAVAGVPVGIVGWFAEDADRAGLLFPLEDAAVGDVAPQQKTSVAEPHRTFAPAASRVEALDRRVEGWPDPLETRIERDDRRIGIEKGGLPAGFAHRI